MSVPTNTRRSGIDDAGRLRKVTLSGKSLRADLVEACLSASVSASMTSVTELKFTFADDHDVSLFRSGVFQDGMTIAFEHWRGRIRGGAKLKASAGGPQVEITAPSLFVERLKSHTGSRNWGHQSVNQWVKGQTAAVGMASQVQPYIGFQDIVREGPGDDEAATDSKPSTWSVITDLAEELDAWVFEHSARLIFAKPSAILNDMPIRRLVDVRWDGWADYSAPLMGMPEFTPGKQSEQRLKIQVVGSDADRICPGDHVRLAGRLDGGTRELNANGRWLVSDVSIPLSRTTPVALTCVRAVKDAI